jgi:hypothetical protein
VRALEASERCLLSIDLPKFTQDPDTLGGTVRISGRISPAGRIEDMRVDEPRSAGVGADRLIAGVMSHLATWRFEPAAASGALTVTYRYAIDAEIIAPAIEIKSVTQIVVRANPRIAQRDIDRLLRKGVTP